MGLLVLFYFIDGNGESDHEGSVLAFFDLNSVSVVVDEVSGAENAAVYLADHITISVCDIEFLVHETTGDDVTWFCVVIVTFVDVDGISFHDEPSFSQGVESISGFPVEDELLLAQGKVDQLLVDLVERVPVAVGESLDFLDGESSSVDGKGLVALLVSDREGIAGEAGELLLHAVYGLAIDGESRHFVSDEGIEENIYGRAFIQEL